MLKILPTLRRACSDIKKIQNLNYSSVYIFDRNVKKLQRNRITNDPNYKDYEYIKSEIGWRVADRVFDITRKFDTVLDMGCQRGFVSKNFDQDVCKKIYMYEMSENLLKEAETPANIEVEKKVFDEEEGLPFADNSLDLVVSSLNLHWVNDLPNLFKDVLRCLKPDCAFLGAMFAGDTLFELRVALQLAELERKGGITSRISPFTSAADIGSLLNTTGYRLLTLDYDEICISYPSMFELMYDVKGMGESNCSLNRKLNLNKDLLLAAQSIYQEMYGNEDGSIPATYQVLYFIAWKQDPSQQKPAKRGSAQVSLKDLNKLNALLDAKEKEKEK